MNPSWHQRLAARLPWWLYRRVLYFEAAIDEEVERFASALPSGTRVLDAGAGEGRHARHFSRCHYSGVDLAVGEQAWDYSRLDARTDLARLPFADRAFGAALSMVVLEHVPDPARVLAEMARVLEPGAPLLLAAPQEWGVHQAPHDYFRYTRYGLEHLVRQAGFELLRIAPAGGFFTLLGRRLLDAVLYFQGGWRWLLFPFAAILAGPPGLLLPLFDFLDREKNSTLGYLCSAKKL